MQKRPSSHFIPISLPVKFPFKTEASADSLPASDTELIYAFHDCAEFVYCQNGKGILQLGNKTFFFEKDDVLYISPYMSHLIVRSGENDCSCISLWIDLTEAFDPSIFREIHEFGLQLMIPFFIPPVIHAKEHSVFTEMIVQMQNEMKYCKKYYEMSARGYCMCALSEMEQFAASKNDIAKYWEGAPVLFPAIYTMVRDYTKPLKIKELAELCHLSETHFRRLFLSCFSMSPLDYLNRIRIRQSCFLMSRNPISISLAADLSGFRTLSSYNRKFLQVMGMSPTQWIKTYL